MAMNIRTQPDDAGIYARECMTCGKPVDLRTCVIAADRVPYCSETCRREREDAYDDWLSDRACG